jgi:hypothetical protein
MSVRKYLLAIWGMAIVLGGCAGTPVDPKDEALSLVYGYFDMKAAPSSLDWVSIKQYGKEAAWYQVSAKDGLFWHVGVESGSYQVEKFGGTGGIPLLTRREFQYDFGTKGRNDTALRIQTPGVYFMGAYKYVDHPGGFFKEDKFEMKPAKEYAEKDLLQKLIKELESDKDLRVYTRQIDLAKKRLAGLS